MSEELIGKLEIGDRVMFTEGEGVDLTPNKKYEVVGTLRSTFRSRMCTILNDAGSEIGIRFSGCAHIQGEKWIRVQRSDKEHECFIDSYSGTLIARYNVVDGTIENDIYTILVGSTEFPATNVINCLFENDMIQNSFTNQLIQHAGENNE